MKARKTCWTCTARRVQCDGARPACNKCATSRRECLGYESRLSWPRDGDKKRAIVVSAPGPKSTSRYPKRSKLWLINTTSRDVSLHHRLTSHVPSGPLLGYSAERWARSPWQVDHTELVQYFHNSAHRSLVTFSTSTWQLRDALLRMAFGHDTISGQALIQALLAFSSLHRSGLHPQAVQLKIAALHSLSQSAKASSMTSVEAAQHVAASMLLAAFEVFLSSESSGEWIWHIWGAADLVQTCDLRDRTYEMGIGHLLDWVSYHDTLSHFATQHWSHKSLFPEEDPPEGPDEYRPLARYRPTTPSLNPSHAILHLLSEVCETLVDPSDPRASSSAYRNTLEALEQKIGSVHISTPPWSLPSLSSSSSSPASDTTATTTSNASADDDDAESIQIYQLATQIYLTRASQSPWNPQTTHLDALIDQAFSETVTTCACTHFFPLFIIACEARTDTRREAILNLLERKEREGDGRSIAALREGILAIWVQTDLHADGDLLVDYVGLMSAVISSNGALPSFV